ncbi:MAG TPA: arylamine N-acetyltransferase [Actinospica sp.]|nr:arylamine N-acetyltransferase [Actinospica sp.]
MTFRDGAVRPDPTADIDGYLARLGVERPERPNLAWLFAVHRAHMERVPYENLEIQLGRATTVDPAASIGRIARGRGGYCFHLNGALGTLLAAVGYDVTRHLGEVRGASTDQASTELTINHQVLTVACEGETWFVDAGLGDAPYEPMPLRAGQVAQGPFTYGLEPWDGRAGGWRFVHDPRQESFTSMVFAPEPVEPGAFAAAHLRLSTAPDSDFVRALVAGRRHALGADVLRGKVLYRIEGSGVTREQIDVRADWYALLADVFGLRLTDVGEAERARLWERIVAAHERWLAERAATQQ